MNFLADVCSEYIMNKTAVPIRENMRTSEETFNQYLYEFAYILNQNIVTYISQHVSS
jgi:hypothetical protein